MKYLTVKDVLLLHDMAVDGSGGSHGLRDIGLLESAVARPESSFDGEELYPTIFLKAGALIHSLLRNHPFVDGNKRTSIFATMTFLELNKYTFIAEQKEIVIFALKVENEKLSVEQIADWLKDVVWGKEARHHIGEADFVSPRQRAIRIDSSANVFLIYDTKSPGHSGECSSLSSVAPVS